MANFTSMDRDLELMERTEKLVAEMLKSAMDDNCCNYKLPSGIEVDDSLECIFINGNSENFNRKFNDQTRVLICEETVEVSEQIKSEDSDEDNSIELDSFIVEGLHKIRTEYPLYSDLCGPHGFGNVNDGPTPIMVACPNANMNSPYRVWYAKPPSRVNSWPIYEDNSNCSFCDDPWNNASCSRNGSNVSLQWSHSSQSMSLSNAALSSIDDYDDAPLTSDEENREVIDSNTLPNESHDDGVDCNKENSDPMENSNVNSNCASSATDNGPLAGAIHAEQTTTTTTTTASGFGLLHQQTSSCTTTNFIPNNLANAVLVNSPAALYAQSILTSTAHQYLSVFRKEVQQYLTSINYSAMSIPNLNLGFYERLFLTQLLQQQIAYQQQQQQIALAALIQQQKLAAQISTNIPASTTFLHSNPNSNSNSNVNLFSASASPSRSGLNNNINNNNNNNINISNNINACNNYNQAKVNVTDIQAIITEEYLGANQISNSE